MKIILFGKSGMMGSCFCNLLAGEELFAYDRNEVDITDFDALEDVILGVEPDIVINCAAYTEVDNAEENKEMAFLVNGEAPGKMAELCAGVGAKFIHFSTDYVFDGKKPGGYNENDRPAPINVYGESKLLGEKLIMEKMRDYFIIRTSWLFGKGGKNFVDTMLELAGKRSELEVVGGQIGSPTYVEDLCRAVADFVVTPRQARCDKNVMIDQPVMVSPSNHDRLLERKLDFRSAKIYHLTNSGACSRYEFALKIFELKKLNVKVKKISSVQSAKPAKRPEYSILINNKLPKLRPWQEALKDYLD
ncbi:dTDP-4-dehydrorhamnose reductase [Candidatus Peregrinibacteria bacterium]|nr:dTDP-4-dehydrorhamnose reductase [Candidatus Peregrinibacteria bacterium]